MALASATDATTPPESPSGLEAKGTPGKPLPRHAPKLILEANPSDANLALYGEMLHLFTLARTHRRPMVQQWERNYRSLYNDYWGQTRATWLPSPALPEIYPIVDALVSWESDQRPRYTIAPQALPHTEYARFFEDVASNLETVLDASYQVNDEEGQIAIAEWDKYVYGTGILKTTWDMTLAGGLGDAITRRVSPFAFYPDPQATSLDDANYFIELRRMSIQELDRRYPGTDSIFREGGTDIDSDREPNQILASTDGEPRRVFSSWKTTINAFEARCARTNDLPLMLDDTKEASNPSLTSSAVYMITNGDSKERGTQTGSYRAGMKFRKVLISTGENLILDTNEHGGVRARVLSLTGLPLGAKSQEAGILARSLTTDASTHYGHAGEVLVRALCDGTLSWPDLRTEYTALKQALEATTGDEGLTARLAAYVALLQLAGRLLVNLCGVDLPVDDHIASIWALCTKAATESDPVANALNTIWGYQDSNRNRLVGAVEVPPHGTVPHGGWLGKCAVLDGKPVVYVVVDEAKRVLTSAGHNFAALCRSWVEEGILAPDPDGKSARVTRIGGGSQRCLCFWQGKVEKALGGVPDENDSPY